MPASTLIFLGRADVGTATSVVGDGTATVRVMFDREVSGRRIKTSTAAPATAFKVAYPNASKEATSAATINAPYGLCLEVDSVFGAFVADNF
ncbi:MAG: hypothetical protein ACOYBP_08895 [Microbacteriaceae bacterium]